MIDDERYRKLLIIARRDLRALERMQNDVEAFVDKIFGFHAQQAVEKAVKAWIVFSHHDYPKTHDLQELFNLLEDYNQEVLKEFYELIDFTDFAVAFRYETLEGLDAHL